MPTVADVLKRIERLRKDLEYVRNFQEKWKDQKLRFPKIYAGIVEQERAFKKQVDDLRNLGVSGAESFLDDARGDDAKPIVSAPAIEGGRRRDSDDARAAANGISEKLRARQTAK